MSVINVIIAFFLNMFVAVPVTVYLFERFAAMGGQCPANLMEENPDINIEVPCFAIKYIIYMVILLRVLYTAIYKYRRLFFTSVLLCSALLCAQMADYFKVANSFVHCFVRFVVVEFNAFYSPYLPKWFVGYLLIFSAMLYAYFCITGEPLFVIYIVQTFANDDHANSSAESHVDESEFFHPPGRHAHEFVNPLAFLQNVERRRQMWNVLRNQQNRMNEEALEWSDSSSDQGFEDSD